MCEIHNVEVYIARRQRTPTLAPLGKCPPFVASGHVQQVPDEGKTLGARRERAPRLLLQEAVQKNDRHQDGSGVQEGRRVCHSNTRKEGEGEGRREWRPLRLANGYIARPRDIQSSHRRCRGELIIWRERVVPSGPWPMADSRKLLVTRGLLFPRMAMCIHVAWRANRSTAKPSMNLNLPSDLPFLHTDAQV